MRHWLANIKDSCIYVQGNIQPNVPQYWYITEVFSLSDIPDTCINKPTEELE
jgi:hypothetical protein